MYLKYGIGSDPSLNSNSSVLIYLSPESRKIAQSRTFTQSHVVQRQCTGFSEKQKYSTHINNRCSLANPKYM